jgi:hypothetical protein
MAGLADFKALCRGGGEESRKSAALVTSAMEQGAGAARAARAALQDPARTCNDIMGCSLPPGTGLDADQPPDLKKIVPPSLHRLLLNPDDQAADPFKQCHCGAARNEGGPCLWRALARERNRAWVQRVAHDAARIHKACASGQPSALTERFAGKAKQSCVLCAHTGKACEQAFDPCGHLVLCQDCEQTGETKCPQCNDDCESAAKDFEFAPDFVPVEDEDWLLLSLGRAHQTREKFVRACCLEIWSPGFLGPGNGFVCVQATAELLGVSNNYLTKGLDMLNGKSRRQVWMEELGARQSAEGAGAEQDQQHGGGHFHLRSVAELAKLDSRTCEPCTCGSGVLGRGAQVQCSCRRIAEKALRDLRMRYSESASMAEQSDILISVLWDVATQRPGNTSPRFASALFGVSERKCRAVLRSCIEMVNAGDADLVRRKVLRRSAQAVPANKATEDDADAVSSFLEIYTRSDPESKWRVCTSPDMNGMRALYRGWVAMYPEIK